MKWRYVLIPFILLHSSLSFSTHIVGGEIELVHDSAYFYEVNLILYFDEINGNPQAEDPFVRIGIFRKFDDALMDTLLLPKVSDSNVPYSYPDCSIPELSTKRITYSARTELSPGIYNDFGGYYIAWDRCCRNNTISNLLAPGTQGQLFYLEFPPTFLAGQQFINSSPVLFPPVSDYGCRNNLFYFDFRGSDPDGDSLVYSLSNPLKGNSSVNDPSFPIPLPGPYPTVIWQTGFDVNNMIPGNPPLQISTNGFITVNPSQNGLFVFAVKCEEYRNGIKIGEIRRDFQIIVRDCPSNAKPAISVQNPIDSSNVSLNDTLYFDLNNRCFDIFLKDSDPDTQFEVEINTFNFDPSVVTISPENGLLPSGGDSLQATICFNKCASSPGEPYQFEIILSDDGCSLPKKDTFLITAIVDAIPDQPPVVNSNFVGDSIILEVGETIFFTVNGFDSDNDTIVLGYGNMGYNPDEYGMQLLRVRGAGQVSTQFSWTPDCKALDLDGQDLILRVNDFICTDFDDELIYPIKIISDNKQPTLTSDITGNEVEFDIREGIEFDLQALDSNVNDVLLLRLTISDSSGLVLQNLNYDLSPTTDRGSLQSSFKWEPNCDFLDIGKMRFDFSVVDNGCERMLDSLSFLANLTYENSPPQLSIAGGNIDGKRSYSVDIFTDSIAVIDFIGEDSDFDLISLEWQWGVDASDDSLPVSFIGDEDFGNVEGTIRIGPGTCSTSELFERELLIILDEESCENLKDTIELNIEIEEFYKEVKVPNVFTPNGDGINDYFYPQQLPKKCKFAEIEIYNRWGRTVYQNSEPDFRWDGKNVPAGDYFYLIRFEETNYKGIIKVLK